MFDRPLGIHGVVIRFRFVDGREFEERVRGAYTLPARDLPVGGKRNTMGPRIENAGLKRVCLPVRRHRTVIGDFERGHRRRCDLETTAHGVHPEWTSWQ